jgi:hypothetical protein
VPDPAASTSYRCKLKPTPPSTFQTSKLVSCLLVVFIGQRNATLCLRIEQWGATKFRCAPLCVTIRAWVCANKRFYIYVILESLIDNMSYSNVAFGVNGTKSLDFDKIVSETLLCFNTLIEKAETTLKPKKRLRAQFASHGKVSAHTYIK